MTSRMEEIRGCCSECGCHVNSGYDHFDRCSASSMAKEIADLKATADRWAKRFEASESKNAALAREAGELREAVALVLSNYPPHRDGMDYEHLPIGIKGLRGVVNKLQPSPAEPFSLKVKADISDVIPGTLPSGDFPPAAEERDAVCKCGHMDRDHYDPECMECECNYFLKTPQGSV